MSFWTDKEREGFPNVRQKLMSPQKLPRADLPPDVRDALAPLVQWIATLAVETALAHVKENAGPRYYDANSAPMGKTAFLRLAAQNAFPSFRVGKRVRAKADDVHAYMEAQQSKRRGAPRARVEDAHVDVNALSPLELHALSLKDNKLR